MKTLILNSDYRPMAIRHAKNVIHRSVFRPIKYHREVMLDSAGREHRIPSVVVVSSYIKTVYRHAKFSKRAVYVRDNFTCQYSGHRYHPSELTIDHVIPKSRPGGESTFENTVVCHKDINRLKGNRTPEEAGLTLLRRPRAVTVQDLLILKISTFSSIPDDWKDYIDV